MNVGLLFVIKGVNIGSIRKTYNSGCYFVVCRLNSFS